MTQPGIFTLQLDSLLSNTDRALAERQKTEFLRSPDGLQLFTQRWLPESSTRAVVVLVHGVAEHSGRYAVLAASLAERGIAVEAMDQRGHGRSEGRRVWVDRFDQYLDDFDQFMDRVQRRHPAKPLFIMGHSLGGTITTLYALERKPAIQGIILSAPALRPGRNVPEWVFPLGRFLGRYLPHFPVRKFSSSEISHSTEAIRRFEEDPLDYCGWLPARTAGEILNAITRIDSHPEQFHYALLLLHGTGDRVTHPEGSRSFHQRAASADKTLRLYDGLYHGLLDETEKEQVVADIILLAGVALLNRSALRQGDTMNLQTTAASLKIEFRGPSDYLIKGVRDIERLSPEQALEENYIYFIESLAVFKRHPKAVEGGLVLTIPALAEKFKQALVAPERDVRLAFIQLLKQFDKTPVFEPGISPQAQVHPSANVAPSAAILAGAIVMEGATVGARCTVYPGVVIEPFAEIGEGTILYPCVVIGHHCVIGKNGIIHGGTVIGADGFGFFDQPGQRYKIPQIGNVIIDDEVEIGASCTVDRATIESTRIGAYTKLDDQVHVGHNSQLGRFIYIVGNSAIGGSVTVGDGAMISGMVIIKDHLKIAPGSIIMGMSGVAQDTEPKTAYFGTPARPAKQMHRMHAALEKLPELLAKVRELEETIKNPVPR